MPTVWQSGVIPYRIRQGKLEVLLVTTSSGKNWIIPKGWVALWMTPETSAAKEALEEAGVIGVTATLAIGYYRTQKWGYPCRVEVFPMLVEAELETYPEAKRRQRKWMSISQAIESVRQSDLKRLLAEFGEIHIQPGSM